jgi:hypothetical protein
MEEFSSTVEAVSQFMVIPEVSLFPTFQAIQQFKNLPDFLMFPAFLALTPKSLHTHASSQYHGIEIIEAIETFLSFGNKARGRNRLASDTLSYACKNWAMHLSQAPSPWDDALIHVFKVFWDDHLLAWLEGQWCLRGLPSCLAVLSEGQKLAKVIFSTIFTTRRLIRACAYRSTSFKFESHRDSWSEFIDLIQDIMPSRFFAYLPNRPFFLLPNRIPNQRPSRCIGTAIYIHSKTFMG